MGACPCPIHIQCSIQPPLKLAAPKVECRYITGGLNTAINPSAVLPNRIKRRLEQPATEAAARKETLEARLLRAERQRANYLKHKGGCAGACHNQGHRMIEQGDILSRKLARCWRRFSRVKGTTYELAQNFSSCDVNLRSVASLPFEELASILISPKTLQSAKALLARLESRLMLSIPDPSGVPKVEHLLKRLLPQRKVGSSGQQRKIAVSQKSKLERYPARVFLCAYMIIGHPDSVFHAGGDDVREVALAEAAAKLIPEFETLVSTIMGNNKEAASKPLSSQLVSFDAAWKSYLSRFVAWKTKDVKLLEEDLINIACKLELLMSQEGANGASDIYKEALENQKLLKDRVFRITGKSGVKKMEDALVSTRSKFLESSPYSELTNEQILNEILHDTSGKTPERPTVIGRIQAQVKATVENAFWASVEENFVEGQNHHQVVGLIREIREGLEDLVPEAWKEELRESLDVELVSQVLESGSNDFRYLQKLMDYSVNLILKLGTPARDRELMDAYASLLEDLSVETKEAFGKALVKGIRFILEHLQKLKQDICTAKLQQITGYSGVEYLHKAFAKRYDLKPEDAQQQLVEKIPRVAEWISNVKSTLQVQKREVDAALNALLASSGASQMPTAFPIRTGGRVGGTPLNSLITKIEAEERSIGKAPWGTTEAAVRLGLLDIICGSEPWTEESLPETLHLNAGRIRNCQNEFQRIAIMATALLILRQELRGKLESAEVERAIEEGVRRLDTLLGELSISIAKIGSVLARICAEHCKEQYQDVNASTEFLVRVLERSLSPGDIVFGRVASAVRNSLRAILVLGNGPEGISLAKAELNKIGAVLLIRDILVLVENLAKMSTVTAQVHGPWYNRLLAAK